MSMEGGKQEGELGRGEGSLKKQETVHKVRCHREARQDGAWKSSVHLTIRRPFGDVSESNVRDALRQNA